MTEYYSSSTSNCHEQFRGPCRTMNKQKREYKQEPQTVLWNAAHGLYETGCCEASGGPWNIGRYYEKMVD